MVDGSVPLCVAGESPVPAAGQKPSEPSLTAQSRRGMAPGRDGRQGALRSCPRHKKILALLCSLSLNWKDHIFTTVYTLGSSGAPFKGRRWGVRGCFSISCAFPN